MLDVHVSTNVNHDGVIKWNHFRVQAPCEGNPRGESWIPPHRPVTRSFDVFFDVRLKKRLNKRSRCRWFETLWRSLWRDVTVMLIESYAKQMKNKRTGPISKMHYFSAFSVRKLDVDLWASQNEMNYSVCVFTLWLNIVVSLTGVNDITYAQNCKRLDCPISYIAPIGQALWWLIVILRMHNGGIFHIEIASANIFVFGYQKIKQAAHDNRFCDPWLTKGLLVRLLYPCSTGPILDSIKAVKLSIKLEMHDSDNFGRWYRRWSYWQNKVSVIVKLSYRQLLVR